MRRILRNRALILTVLGLAIMAQSVLWEYVRVEPTYRFIVDPWSMRGFELSQGLVIAAGATAIAVFAILVVRNVIKETFVSSAIGIGAGVVVAVAIAVFADAGAVKMPFLVHLILATIGGVVAVAIFERFLPEAWDRRRRLARIGIWIVSFAVLLFGIVGPLLNNEQEFWIFVLMASLIVGGLSLLRPPTELAGRRWLINTIVAVWMMSMTMSASLRQAIFEAQDANGTPAQLLDLQITSGVLLAWFGGLLAFTGAVGMWAKRRDQIIAHERARRQQEAARESEQQLTV